MEASPQFGKLRKTYFSFIFPMSIVFSVWYFAYVLTAIYAPGLMAVEILGLNFAMWFGMAQLCTTFLITGLYVWYANTRIEPQAAAIRQKMEG